MDGGAWDGDLRLQLQPLERQVQTPAAELARHGAPIWRALLAELKPNKKECQAELLASKHRGERAGSTAARVEKREADVGGPETAFQRDPARRKSEM